MSHAGFSNRRVAGKMGVHHSVIDRLMGRLQANGMVDERLYCGWPSTTTPREDKLIAWCARRNCFATTARFPD